MPPSAPIRPNRCDGRARRAAALQNESGIALIGVLLLTAAIFALGIFGTQGAQVELGIAGNDLRAEQALALAEAGVHHAYALVKNAGNTGFDTELADGTGGALASLGTIVAVRGDNYRFRHLGVQDDDGYYVRIEDNFDETNGTNDPTDDQDLKVSIISRGFVGNAERVVSVSLERTRAFPYAFFGKEYVTLGGGMITDSFDSRVADYNSATAGSFGSVRSNGDVNVSSAAVDGDATASGVVSISNGSSVSGVSTDGAPKLEFPAVAACGPPYSDGTGISGTVTLADGTYCFSTIKESSHGLLEVNGPVNIYVTGDVDATGDGINNTTKLASNFQLYSSYNYSGQGVRIRSHANTYVAVYAPDTCVKASGGSDFFGSMISRCVDTAGGSGLHYDEALGKDITVGDPKLTSWTEERNF
jgi:hypothetical protein